MRNVTEVNVTARSTEAVTVHFRKGHVETVSENSSPWQWPGNEICLRSPCRARPDIPYHSNVTEPQWGVRSILPSLLHDRRTHVTVYLVHDPSWHEDH